jgi:hypothetical protein
VIRPFELRFPELSEYAEDGYYFNGSLKEANPEVYAKLTHTSETELEEIEQIDYTIINNGTLDDLRLKVKTILKKEKLID